MGAGAFLVRNYHRGWEWHSPVPIPALWGWAGPLPPLQPRSQPRGAGLWKWGQEGAVARVTLRCGLSLFFSDTELEQPVQRGKGVLFAHSVISLCAQSCSLGGTV